MNVVRLILLMCLVGSPSMAEESMHYQGLITAAESLYTAALENRGVDRAILAQRSAALYEEAVSEGGRWNGYLLYNLGTAYHLSGSLGRAILNYRRAEQLVPAFDDLKANLALALNQRKDRIEPGQKEEIMRGLFFWHYVIGAATRRRAFAISFVLIWIFLTMNTIRSSGTAKALAGIATVFSLALGLSIGSDFLSQQQQNRGVLVSEEVMARKGPGQSYAPAYEGGLHEGTEIKIMEHDGGWFRVGLIDGSQCWVPDGTFETY
jgi:tetratricopeptide (TPR) repeat protein